LFFYLSVDYLAAAIIEKYISEFVTMTAQ